MSEVVNYSVETKNNVGIAVVTVDSPPVNALSIQVRKGLQAAFRQFEGDHSAQIAVLICDGRTFIAGADITEFGKPPEDPWLPEVIKEMEASDKVIVAAIHGTALGGGLETAMGCHYRCAIKSAKIGLPEVTLGLLPGATGTQRLPRLVGPKKALDIMITGRPISAESALESGAIDAIVEGDLKEGALEYASQLVKDEALPKRISQMSVDKTEIDEHFFAGYRNSMARSTRGFFAPEKIVQCVEAAVDLPYEEAVEKERELFMECMYSSHSVAQRHMFFAERACTKVPDVPSDTPLRNVAKVAVIGGGTMGGGIAMNFANAGLSVVVKEISDEALKKGLEIIQANYDNTVSKGRMTADARDACMKLISGTTSYDEISDCDLIVEAVFENMALKKEIFQELDKVAKAGAILASNTSTLDIDEIAQVTSRPADVIGWHFFAPANVMTLLELVRGSATSKEVIATSMAVAKKIKKTAVLVGVCFGFVGNRMFFPYVREAQLMILEGVGPERIDQVAFDWGMAMGPNGVSDLSGLDVLEKVKNEWAERPDDPALWALVSKLVEQGRYGQKTGAGIFNYAGRSPVPDEEVAKLAKAEAERIGISQRDITDDEIIERLMYSMINEGALILGEGIATKSSDIDVVFVHGYGMPRYRGGPMCYADEIGLDKVIAGMEKYKARYGDMYWEPAPLLKELSQSGKQFADWSK